MIGLLRRAGALALLAAVTTGTFSIVGEPMQTGHETRIVTERSKTYESKTDEKEDTAIVEATEDRSDSTAPSDGTTGPQDQYLRSDAVTCRLLHSVEVGYGAFFERCPFDGVPAVDLDALECGPGSVELADLWVRRVDADGGYGEAEHVADASCVTPADVAAEAERAFAQLQVTAPPATIQAARPLLVNVHYPVQANAAPVEQEFTLLEVPVLIRAEPAEYTWDFDDPHKPSGGTLTTSEPGSRWHDGMDRPDASWVGHTYTHLGDPDEDPGTARDAEGDWYRDDVTITLSTTWRGMFQLVGTSQWTDIDGTLSTTSTLDPLTVTEARVRLVCSDLDGNRTC